MSIQLKSPSGGWTSVGNPTSYSSVVANYASAIKQAQNEQELTEIQSKIFSYKQGTLDYGSLQTFLNGKITAATAGSQRELDLREALADVEEYERTKNINIERSRLEAQYAKDGISAEERRIIEEQLLTQFKVGTPDYTQQLNVIAQARELESVESKNTKLAEIEAELSRGGLTSEEELSYLEQARGLTETGTEERAKIDSQIAIKKEDVKIEQRDAKVQQRLSEMMSQYTEGGFTNDELLSMNLELQSFYEPGTEEFNDLKEKEAEIRGAIATDSTGTSAETKNQAESVLAEIAAQRSNLLAEFKAGRISDEQLQQGEDELIAASEEIYGQLGDSVYSDESLAKGLGELNVSKQTAEQQKELMKAGKLITVVNPKNGEQETVSNDPRFLSNFKEDMEVGFLDESGQAVLEGDAEGKVVKSPVVTVTSGEQQFKATLKSDGTLEVVKEVPDAAGNMILTRTGTTFDPVRQRRILAGEADTSDRPVPVEQRVDVGGLETKPGFMDKTRPLANTLASAFPFTPKFDQGVQELSKKVSSVASSVSKKASEFKLPEFKVNLPKITAPKITLPKLSSATAPTTILGKANTNTQQLKAKASSSLSSILNKAKSFVSGLFGR